MTKIAIIGAGAVGSTTAYTLSMRNLAAEIILIDSDEEKEQGQVMDIGDGVFITETGRVRGADLRDAREADIIIVAAGAAQKPGESRLDLAQKNRAICASIFKGIGRLKKSAVVIIIANPVDVLTYCARELARLPDGQVLGTGTALDTARLKNETGMALGVSPQSVEGFVLGEHGDSGFAAWSTVCVGGVPVSKLAGLTPSVKLHIEKQVRTEAARIIQKKGATHFGIASISADIVEAILFDQKKIIPVSTFAAAYNGVSDVCLGVPAVIGARGAERLWPLSLPADERKKLKRSADILKALM